MADIGAYDAKTHLPKLLERVEKGERFVITRHGKPVAEIRPTAAPGAADPHAFYEWLASRRLRPRGPPITSVELLNQIYDEPDS